MNWVESLEGWFERKYQIRPIADGGYIARLGVIWHRGPRLVLRDGTVINPGDPVGELHIDNKRAAGLHATGKGGIRLRREVFRMLPVLARELTTRPEYRGINAVFGASLFWDGAGRVGFENRPVPFFTRLWLGWWERFLMARYHPAGWRRLAEGPRREIREVWMTRRALLERYGGEGARAKGTAAADREPEE
jgi:hypothetical protein